jgi:nicotinate phosphoribosyltransferase
VKQLPSLEASKAHAGEQLSRFHSSIKRLTNPHEYPAGVAENLFELRNRLILEWKGS